MMKKIFFALLIALLSVPAFCGEGMWLPLLLKQLNEKEMQDMGMRMTAEDIYSVNKGSLKDAIVQFGGGCTGEIISAKGLLMTNHHCGLGQIQRHSSLENNYLENGFWAGSPAEELPNPGLTVTFIVRMEDVTGAALSGVTPDLSERDRQSLIDKNLALVQKTTQRESYQNVMVRPFFHGNQYYLFVTETYRDVRLVGSPPDAIGSFGADTDNWVWPRHSGDFALFRIYAGPDNLPADYSPDNVPFQPKHFLPISLDGVEEGDFTLVFGFPGATDQYLPAIATEQEAFEFLPRRVRLRDLSLEVLNADMAADPKVKIQYASKQSRIANAWKKWKGVTLGLQKTGGVEKKRQMEKEFQRRVDADPVLKAKYGKLLADLERLHRQREPYAEVRNHVFEITTLNVEIFRLAGFLDRFIKIYKSSGLPGVEPRKESIMSYLESFYKDYRPETDKKVFSLIMEAYYNDIPVEYLSKFAVDQIVYAGKDYGKLADLVFAKSILSKPDATLQAAKDDLEKFLQAIEGDYAYELYKNILSANEEKTQPAYNNLTEEINLLQRTYMQALMEVFPEKRFYPDANSTLRVTYGQVAGYKPRDGVKYLPNTYLSGVMEKYIPGDYEFDVPEKLRQLYEKKDYGPYGEDGEMPVCFIGSNHTTGGNSGSPVIDAHGNLIGINFDRVWEGTMSDYYYDPSICRNIMVDIRYILFIIDKFAGAGHLVQEMKLVRPKEGTGR
jgi:hypothetical protein